MSHFCCSCGNLDPKKKAPGKENGNLYFCKKVKTYVSGSSTSCDNFTKADGRKSWQTDEIYKDGKLYSNSTAPVGLYLIILIVLIIAAILINIF